MKIKKVDDKPMVIHTKKKAKIHMHEPKKAKIKGSNIYTVQRGPKIASAKINDTGKKKSYPIWWGDAPRIISTFMESYDFSGKTIIPFCTSGGSGISSSAANLEKLTSGANWLEGKRLNGSDSQDTIMEWAKSLGLF